MPSKFYEVIDYLVRLKKDVNFQVVEKNTNSYPMYKETFVGVKTNDGDILEAME